MSHQKITSLLFASSLVLGAASFSVPAISAAQTPLVTVAGLDHVGINVPDLNQAISFFRTTFGATLESDIAPGAIPAAWKTAYNWHQSSELKHFAMVRLPNGTGVELFEYSGKQVDHHRPHQDDDAETHIALKTSNVMAGYQAVKEAGLKTLSSPVTNADGTQWFYFLTPWGSQIELTGKEKNTG
ncbi:VOC family protein [Tatumella sp. UBA2305]|uniref:VOC family protein n=1 Tax=Tatumella sp. UBA2305 TaxID=1947647 RepID=UPI0025ECBF52|nr:VOC family protein [Tatumella sp. UBA2305]